MVLIPDDPIVRSMERTGYPPWMQDDICGNDDNEKIEGWPENWHEEEEERRSHLIPVLMCL